ncbi:MAG TPA: UbiA prenyltransferase family protein [Candidatus Thermoplasmatota archaeon]|nr:UbiA prenyltransferase family protein [Candidatus Thermoplasmatota archaeon]
MREPGRLPPLLALLRPRQWYKNVLVLVPLVFSGNTANLHLWPRAGLAFLAFCLLASAAYAVNDFMDAPRDRAHPVKRHRPVAAGAVAPGAAVAVAVALALAGLALLAVLNPATFLMGVLYLLLQALYNGGLKHVLLWDALAVAGGFVLRALAGTTALEVGPPTEWLIVCTFLLALYLALAKRSHELLLESGAPAATRPALADYSPAFVQQAMTTSATLLLASYTLYTFFGATRWMMFTLPFAFYGIFRHSWLAQRRDLGDEAELILRDRATLLNAALWLLVVLLVLAHLPQRAWAWVEALA